ncbi:unnamed protein product [Protopolystoma xenopodis]|uniref:Secreted protein n=1 Tax=Protopolystoma xenopodis TaxID=117903 RepID=A0A448XRF1_9PLAT|nr:unnamed protein product [Protopolystoma xenopodis]
MPAAVLVPALLLWPYPHAGMGLGAQSVCLLRQFRQYRPPTLRATCEFDLEASAQKRDRRPSTGRPLYHTVLDGTTRPHYTQADLFVTTYLHILTGVLDT